MDLHIDDLHERGIQGHGVIVVVMDSPIDHTHVDLAKNMVAVNNLKPANHLHGTAIAGIIAAHGKNYVRCQWRRSRCSVMGYQLFSCRSKSKTRYKQ